MTEPNLSRCIDPASIGPLPENIKEELYNGLESILASAMYSKPYDDEGGSIYTGVAGRVLLCLAVGKRTHKTEFLDHARAMIPRMPLPSVSRGFTFLEGRLGHVLLTRLVDRPADIVACLGDICAARMRSDMCELLYGRAGIVHGLMMIRKFVHLHVEEISELGDMIVKLLVEIVDHGMSRRKLINETSSSPVDAPLAYSWHDSEYIGAAHGYVGIIAQLLNAEAYWTDVEEKLHLPEHSIGNLCVRTLNTLLVDPHFMNPSGNPRSSVNSSQDKLVHWCHGATGFIGPCLLVARMVSTGAIVAVDRKLNNQKYWLDHALRLGEVVYRRGLLHSKGPGLCHGVGGNGLELLRIFLATGQKLWYRRAQEFAYWGLKNLSSGYDLMRNTNNPFSLFEGSGGLGWLIMMILHGTQGDGTPYPPQASVSDSVLLFPGYDLVM